MKRLLLAGAALGVLAAALPASAADLRPLYKAPPPALASWAGFYIGANAGGGTATGDFLDMDCLVCADVTFHRGFGEVGGQIGYNWQWGPAVVGVEGDLNWTNATGTRWFALDTQAPGTNQFRFDAFGSIRARAGLAFDRTLIYVTAGPAWGHFNSTTTLGGLVGPIQDVATDNTWHPGVAVGAGAEFKLAPNWSLRGEYLFLDFADRVVNFVPTPSGRPAQAQLRESFGYSAQVARVGLNYWFDAGAAAATSAYAADYRAPIYKAPVAAALPVSWAGFYLGVNAGGGMADAKFLDPDCFTCADVTFHRGFGEAGGQAGYNWQSGAAVLGLEGDLNWASVNESGVLGLPPGFGNAQFGTTQFKLDAFATLRARAGLAVDRALVYVTAGPAWGHFNSVTTTHIGSLAGPVRDIFADDGWHAGLAVGAGAEYMLAPHWLVRAEYLHLAFTDRFVNAVPVNGPATDALTRVNYSYSAHVARLGLSYKLDDGLASAYPSALPTPMYKAPPAPAVSWAGLYIGVNAGGGIANADAWDMDCFTCTNVTVQRGFAEVGGQVGYNWQWASTVLGVEGDLNWASVNERSREALSSKTAVWERANSSSTRLDRCAHASAWPRTARSFT